MDYEVELKFALQNSDQLGRIRSHLELKFAPGVLQIDRYFAHPSRDFTQTDEAFRLRQVGDTNFVTYKGPRIDKQTKTRQELELPLPNGTHVAESFSELWNALGFRAAGTVRKMRQEAPFRYHDRSGHLAYDQVNGLGEFVEIEFICPQQELQQGRLDALNLAAELGLQDPEPRSYLELVLS